MKRQWKAPADNVREASQFEGIQDKKDDWNRDRYNSRHEGGNDLRDNAPTGAGSLKKIDDALEKMKKSPDTRQKQVPSAAQ